MVKYVLVLAALVSTGAAFAVSGNTDVNGCNTSKSGVRKCYGDNAGKYIPEQEPLRQAKLHKSVCTTLDADGRKPRFDYYGKACR